MELPEVGSSIRIRPPAGRKRSNVLRGSALPARGRVLGADIPCTLRVGTVNVWCETVPRNRKVGVQASGEWQYTKWRRRVM